MENATNLMEEQTREVMDTIQILTKAFEQIWKKIKEILIQIRNGFKEVIIKNQKAKKYLAIYERTHNQRIKKKQITKIRKILNE